MGRLAGLNKEGLKAKLLRLNKLLNRGIDNLVSGHRVNKGKFREARELNRRKRVRINRRSRRRGLKEIQREINWGGNLLNTRNQGGQRGSVSR